MIVTIDGPAGAGKSTVAKGLAKRLSFLFLDTGAMYRAATLAVMQTGKLGDLDTRIAVTKNAHIELGDGIVCLDDQDVTAKIRTFEVTENIHFLADDPAVRAILVDRQRVIAKGQSVVTEGRDQGTVVFPRAECKIFLTASAHERARRRQAEKIANGEQSSLTEIRVAQDIRDRRDQNRAVGALKRADDAVELTTDGMTLEQVISLLENLVRKTQKNLTSHKRIET